MSSAYFPVPNVRRKFPMALHPLTLTFVVRVNGFVGLSTAAPMRSEMSSVASFTHRLLSSGDVFRANVQRRPRLDFNDWINDWLSTSLSFNDWA